MPVDGGQPRTRNRSFATHMHSRPVPAPAPFPRPSPRTVPAVNPQILARAVSDLSRPASDAASTYSTCHVAAALGEQEQHRRAELFWLADPPQHVLPRPLFRQPPGSRSLAERRINVSRAQRVHSYRRVHGASLTSRVGVRLRHAAARERILCMAPLCRQRPPQLVNGRLGCIVRRGINPLVADMAAHASDEYNAPGGPGAVHLARYSASCEKRPSDVDVEDPAKRLGSIVAGITFPRYGCAADESSDRITEL
jgi:hypothetical protein